MAPRNATAKQILATRTTMLKVPLTLAELNEVAEQTYKVEGNLRTFYGHKKEVTSDLKAKEEQLDASLARLGRLGRDKHDYRPVPVRIEADFREGKVFEIREDTGEVIGERAVNEQDRQLPLLGAPPPAGSIDDLVGTREEAVARHEASKASTLPITWSTEPNGKVLGVASNGLVYAIEPTSNGYRWVQGRKRSGQFSDLSTAKLDAEEVEVERQADQLLKNASAGELTKKELKGPSEKFRKGR